MAPVSARAECDGISRIEVFHDLGRVQPIWQALEGQASASPYQAMPWVMAWCQSIGAARGITPAIVVAFDATDRPLALLPLGISRRVGLGFCAFLGGTEANLNLGLFDSRHRWDASQVDAMLRSAAALAPIDLFVLRHQPAAWFGQPNPLLTFKKQLSPSGNRTAVLCRIPEDFFRLKLSKHARKGLRQKQARLRALGPVEHRRARTSNEAAAILDAYVEQKANRFAAMGVPSSALSKELRPFLDKAADQERGSAPPLELHALTLGSRIVATFGGTGQGSHFSGMFLSFDENADVARCSPGDLLLAAVIAELCERGFDSFDLGVGEARYKETFCDEAVPLFDSFIGMTLAGRVAASVLGGVDRAKRSVKQSAWAWPLFLRARATAARIRAAARRV